MKKPDNRPPGMGLRIVQKTVDELKNSLQKFLPHYLEYDLDLSKKTEWDLSMLMGFWTYHFIFENVRYDIPNLDLYDTKFRFTNMFDHPMLKVNCPALKSWKIEFEMSANTWILPADSNVVFDMEDLDMAFNTEFETTEKGYLKPILWATDLQWGHTRLYHESWLLGAIFNQWIKLLMIVVKNSIYFFGDEIFNGMLEPPLTRAFNFY